MPSIPSAMVVAGHVVYAADGNDYLQVIDVSDPNAPAYVGHYGTAALDVDVAGQTVYVAASDEGLRLLDVGDTTTPFEIGFYDTAGTAHGVAVAGEVIFVANGDEGLLILEAMVATDHMYLPAVMRSH